MLTQYNIYGIMTYVMYVNKNFYSNKIQQIDNYHNL